MPEPVIVTLEGNIGSGKSTLLRAVEALGRDDVLVVQEPVSSWCTRALPDGRSMLEAYYASPKENAMAFQMYAMLTRVQQMSDAVRFARDNGKRVVVTERCPWSDYEIFGRPMHADLGLLSDAEWVTYTAWFRAATDETAAWAGGVRPTGLVYLRCEPERCEQRIATRNRRGEEAIGRDYLRRIHAAHETYVASARAPGSGYDAVLEVDGVAEGDGAVRAAADRVAAFADGLCGRA